MARVFLDLDGTLTDPFEGFTRSVAYALERLGRPVPDPADLGWAIGPSLWESFDRMGLTKAEADEGVRLYRERYTDTGLFENTPYPGIVDALERIAANGHRMFLATAKPMAYAGRITAHFGLAGFMEDQFGSELDGTNADKPDLVRHAVAQTGTGPAVMVGDRRHDAAGARAVDIPFVGVLWGYGSEDELRTAGAHIRATSPAELPGAIDRALALTPPLW